MMQPESGKYRKVGSLECLENPLRLETTWKSWKPIVAEPFVITTGPDFNDA